MIFKILDSNIVQLSLTALFGAFLYLSTFRFPISIKTIIYLISFGIIISALFNIGEVYIYSDFYKRSFFYFSDQITTILMVCLIWSLWQEDYLLAGISCIAMFLSGGKVSLILFLVSITIFWLQNKSTFQPPILKIILVGIIGYFTIISTSSMINNNNNVNKIRETVAVKKIDTHKNVCTSANKCINSQIFETIKYRYLSSLAGLWMMLQGGFSGEAYPNTREKFAKLMMQENPWKVNQTYNLTYHHWKFMKGVQNPYLAFGSGYGPWLLLLLISTFGIIAYCAIDNLRHGEKAEASLWSIIFVVMVTLNQTQSWLKSGSIVLILIGFCTAHILLAYYRRKILFLPFDQVSLKT